ncbi:hypothetical protein LHK_00634 [Laribacter hongkongensis HLHK9]|uniref:Uncharacterized protein n=1 Tax=Laribacter hongkongensis (strain HLHK9) TaxID=557598 RepID=C1DCZ2_LARHH|nr:hypothetical protein [Laribacter hongkongensis]ACO73627.1 hypothetical protein LHK_00634 [Laribacter hongkongensis HLHK9]
MTRLARPLFALLAVLWTAGLLLLAAPAQAACHDGMPAAHEAGISRRHAAPPDEPALSVCRSGTTDCQGAVAGSHACCVVALPADAVPAGLPLLTLATTRPATAIAPLASRALPPPDKPPRT